MSSISDKIKEAKRIEELRLLQKKTTATKKNLSELKENGKIYQPETPKIEIIMIPAQIITSEDLSLLGIGELRGIHKRIFGVEPPHDKAHPKEWIANKIKGSLRNVPKS